jgi:site-specific DNA-methyltransferase (adenine-specific)
VNIDGCRVELPEGDSLHNPVIHSGKKLDSGNTEAVWGFKAVDRPAGVGRWPANLAHDGSPEVLAQFPDTSSGKMNAGTARAAQDEPGSVCYGTYGGNATNRDTPGDSGSAARFFYCAKTSKADRNRGLDDHPEQPSAASKFRPNHTAKAEAGENGNPYGRWSPVRNTHPTVKPTALMQWLVRLVTPPSGTVLDPFMGSGSTGVAAVLEGFDFIGCEMTDEYVPIATARIDNAVNARYTPKP